VEAAVDDLVANLPAEKEADFKVNRDLSQRWVAAANVRDVDRQVSLFTDDAIMIEPGSPAVTGTEAIRSRLQALSDEVSAKAKTVTVEVRLADDWAFARGTFATIVTPKAGGEPSQISGTWIDIRERQADGSWKISRTMWSPDAPLPEVEK
jgi:uncharacterized protein (TIGR02246 family)